MHPKERKMRARDLAQRHNSLPCEHRAVSSIAGTLKERFLTSYQFTNEIMILSTQQKNSLVTFKTLIFADLELIASESQAALNKQTNLPCPHVIGKPKSQHSWV